jgi:hypothetical protein
MEKVFFWQQGGVRSGQLREVDLMVRERDSRVRFSE